uniref:Ig-like domain-containing protein n=1 Tax=Mammaliicoccus vitulinus TaxID=71237 RepID=UPI003BA2599B
MTKKHKSNRGKIDFIPNKLNKYSIRKFTVGTASIIVGATLLFGLNDEAKAEETSGNTSVQGESKNNNEVNQAEEPLSEQQSSLTEENSVESPTTEETSTEETSTEEPTSETNTTEEASTEEPTSETNTTEEASTEEPTSKTNTTEEVSTEEPTSKTSTTEEASTEKQTPDTNTPEEASTEEPASETNTTEKASTEEPTSETNTTEEVSTEEQTPDTNTTEEESTEEKPAANTTEEVSTEEQSAGVSENGETSGNSSEVFINNETFDQDIENSENKEQVIKEHLEKNHTPSETEQLMNSLNVDIEKASSEEINEALANASLENTLAEQNKFRAVATREASENSDTEALQYSKNYTFQTLIFDPANLTEESLLSSNEIPFEIHNYMTGANSGDRYKINLQLDPVIANHVTRITSSPANRTNTVDFIRQVNENGQLTNIWQVNFIRANTGLFGGAEILDQYTSKNGLITLDDTLENILANAGDLTANKLNYLIYVKDSKENTKIQTSESSGYFITNYDSEINDLPLSTSTNANNAFKASSGSVQFDDNIGEHGGLLIDQQIIKNGTFNYGGKIVDLGLNKQWSYNYNIDKDLLPYIEGVELHTYDFKGVTGFDKTYIPENKVADLTYDDEGNGSITAENMNNLIEFNNSLPETVGIRMVLKFNQSSNNILTRDALYDEEGNLISETTKVKEDFVFHGYFTDKDGGLVQNTYGNSTYFLQDLDRDGLTDDYELQNSLSDPEIQDTDGDGKNDGDEVVRYKTSPLVGQPNAADITIEDTMVSGFVPLKEGAATQTANVINADGQVIGSGIVNSDGTFNVTIPTSSAGDYTISISSPNYENPETNTFKIVDNSIVPAPTINPVDDSDLEIVVNGIGGSTVTIRDQDNQIIGTVDIPEDSSTGSVQLDTPLKAGTILTSTSTKNDKESEVSDPVIVTDNTAPEAPTVNPVTSEDTSVSGNTEPGADVTVTFPDGTTATGKAD